VRRGEVAHRAGAFAPADVDGAAVVVAATDRPVINRAVAAAARAARVLVNVVDTPGACDFHVPAIVRRGALVVAVSTEGRTPALAAHLRRRLEAMLGPEYATVVEVLGALRERLRRRGDPAARRRRFFERLLTTDLVTAVAVGDMGKVDAIVAAVDAGTE